MKLSQDYLIDFGSFLHSQFLSSVGSEGRSANLRFNLVTKGPERFLEETFTREAVVQNPCIREWTEDAYRMYHETALLPNDRRMVQPGVFEMMANWSVELMHAVNSISPAGVAEPSRSAIAVLPAISNRIRTFIGVPIPSINPVLERWLSGYHGPTTIRQLINDMKVEFPNGISLSKVAAMKQLAFTAKVLDVPYPLSEGDFQSRNKVMRQVPIFNMLGQSGYYLDNRMGKLAEIAVRFDYPVESFQETSVIESIVSLFEKAAQVLSLTDRKKPPELNATVDYSPLLSGCKMALGHLGSDNRFDRDHYQAFGKFLISTRGALGLKDVAKKIKRKPLEELEAIENGKNIKIRVMTVKRGDKPAAVNLRDLAEAYSPNRSKLLAQYLAHYIVHNYEGAPLRKALEGIIGKLESKNSISTPTDRRDGVAPDVSSLLKLDYFIWNNFVWARSGREQRIQDLRAGTSAFLSVYFPGTATKHTDTLRSHAEEARRRFYASSGNSIQVAIGSNRDVQIFAQICDWLRQLAFRNTQASLPPTTSLIPEKVTVLT